MITLIVSLRGLLIQQRPLGALGVLILTNTCLKGLSSCLHRPPVTWCNILNVFSGGTPHEMYCSPDYLRGIFKLPKSKYAKSNETTFLFVFQSTTRAEVQGRLIVNIGFEKGIVIGFNRLFRKKSEEKREKYKGKK